MGSNSNNTDFQSELLRMNGALQASITELRYHCEVYRLSLKSICKVLSSVQKEQDARIRCLTTSRPSFHAYLLNLSQRHALDRIKNVVRKASTFINGYSLVDKQLFQPPPPKPSTARRSGDENKTAPATSTTADQVTDCLESGWISYSEGTATVAVPAVSKEINADKEHGDAVEASSKSNNGKVARKHSSGKRRRGEKEKKKASGSRSKSKSKSRASSSSHKHSSTASGVGVDVKCRRSSGDDESCIREIKKSRTEKEKTRRRTSSRFDSANPTIKNKSTERKKSTKQIRSKSITATTRSRHDDHRHHHHRHHQVINSRTSPTQHDEESEEDGKEPGEITCTADDDEPNTKEWKQQSSLMSRPSIVANRIPPLFSIATSATINRNKSFGTPHINEKLRMGARRVQRPSTEKQHEGRRTNYSNRSESQNKEREKKTISRSLASTIRLSEIHESKTTTMGRASTATRRWGNTTSTITAVKAGYKVRESLAVLRNRNSGNAYQGQGVVTRKYLFSSHNPRNNFKLNFTTTSSVIASDKVRRIQLNGSSRHTTGFSGSSNVNGDNPNPYGASRKSSFNNRGNGNGSASSNVGCGIKSNSTSS